MIKENAEMWWSGLRGTCRMVTRLRDVFIDVFLYVSSRIRVITQKETVLGSQL